MYVCLTTLELYAEYIICLNKFNLQCFDFYYTVRRKA